MAQTYLTPVHYNGAWGYANEKGEFIISSNFKSAYAFDSKSGVARVKSYNGWGYVNTEGHLLPMPQIEVYRNYSDGFLLARQNDRWGYVNPEGKFVIHPRYKEAKDFSEGFAVVYEGDWMFLNKDGQVAFPMRFKEAFGFSEGYAFVLMKGGWRYIDNEGRSMNNPPGIERGKKFSDGMARVMYKGKWGYIDTKGGWVIQPIYAEGTDFKEGHACVLERGQWSVIDKTGVLKGQIMYSPVEVSEFSDGLAKAKVDKQGWGYVNFSGEWVISALYTHAKDFVGNTAYVRNLGGMWGVISPTGEEISAFKFRNVKETVKVDYAAPVSEPVVRQSLVQVSNVAPKLEITSPYAVRGFKVADDMFTTSHNSIVIEGTAYDEQKIKAVLVNGRQIFVQEGGKFSIDFPLMLGTNVLKVKAIDNGDLVDEKEVVVRYNPNAGTAVPVVSAAGAEDGKYYALVIGVNDYYDEDVVDLDNPVRDAGAIYQTLISDYTFEPGNVKLLQNPDRDEVYTALEYFTSNVTSKDNYLIFYAGHGYWDESFQKGYWLFSDAEDGRRGSWFSNSELHDYISATDSRHTLLIADACFSGSIFKMRDAFVNAEMDIQKLQAMKSRKAMTSGTLKTVPDESVFMKYLLLRLTNNERSFLPSEYLFSTIKKPVLLNSPNVPQYGEIHGTGGEGGDFIFIKR